MSDITELERRITAALDRIGTGLDELEAPAPAGPDPAELQNSLDIAAARVEELETELSDLKTANAQVDELKQSRVIICRRIAPIWSMKSLPTPNWKNA